MSKPKRSPNVQLPAFDPKSRSYSEESERMSFGAGIMPKASVAGELAAYEEQDDDEGISDFDELAEMFEGAMIGEDVLYIGNIEVTGEHRRAGLARRTVEHVIADAKARGIQDVWLYACHIDSTEVAIAFWQSLGFERVLRGRWGCEIMRRKLTSAPATGTPVLAALKQTKGRKKNPVSRLPKAGPWYGGHKTKIESFDPKYVGGAEAHDQLGPGFYFTSDPKGARYYGPHIHEVTIHWKKAYADPWADASPALVRSFINRIPRDQWESAEKWNWDENGFVARQKAIASFAKLPFLYVLTNLPGTFSWYREHPALLLDVMVEAGYTGMVVPAGSTRQEPSALKEQWAIVWDEKAIEIKKIRTVRPKNPASRLPNPRPIPLDEPALAAAAQSLATEIEQRIAGYVGHDLDRAHEPVSKRHHLLLSQPLTVTVKVGPKAGEEVTMDVRVMAQPTSLPDLVLGGGYGTMRGRPVLVIDLNGSLSHVRFLARSRDGQLAQALDNVLRHEVTHAVDPALLGGRGISYDPKALDLAAYVNDPAEVRAFTQEIVAQARRHMTLLRTVYTGGELVRRALQVSDTYRLVREHLSPKNDQHILRAVAQALAVA